MICAMPLKHSDYECAQLLHVSRSACAAHLEQGSAPNLPSFTLLRIFNT